MTKRSMRCLVLLLVAVGLQGQDTFCPAYPQAQAAAYQRSIARTVRPPRAGLKPLGFSKIPQAAAGYDPGLDVNFIDTALFQQMATDGIQPAGAAEDAEFLRRVMLDVTGRIPSPQQVRDYTSNTDPGKKAALLSTLIGSKEYTDYWTHWFIDRFQVTSDYYGYIGIPGRTLFYNFVRNFIANDGSYQDFATQLISAAGDSHQLGAPNYTMRGIQYSQPIQDTWDEMTNRITTNFLGVQSTCISCHNGRGHLEPINLFLSKKTRLSFWQQSAFLSRMNILFQSSDPADAVYHGYISDRTTGGYNTVLADPNNPGPRPPRTGGPYTPVYLFSGKAPATGAWRKELANSVVNDRQFARAFVNYLWAQLFRVGIVDPPDGFDLARIDAANPPTDPWPSDPSQPWPLQPSHPALLEQLTDAFIQGGYQISPMIRMMVESRAYGLSGHYPGAWTPLHALDFAKSLPRRLTAEELYDSLITATNTQVPMTVEGMDHTLYYAGELPDATEPRTDEGKGLDQYNYIRDFLTTFGRGDWWRTARDNSLNPALMLYFMNAPAVTDRTFGNKFQLGSSLVAQLAASKISNSDAIDLLCLATLGRLPTTQERSAALSYPPPDPAREQWLGDIQWAFLNEAEFFFSH
jgi:hypothetical protein